MEANEPRSAASPRDDATEPVVAENLGRVTTELLVAELHALADRLARDSTGLGDLKLITRAVKELRYAFKVFAPYRNRRKVTVFGSARTPAGEPAYEQAVEFGRRMAQHDWMVITGAGVGIMEAGHVGAGRAQSLGINILLPFEQTANRIIEGDSKLVHLKYFFTRKLLFIKEAHAVALFPGGFGTLDEGFEALTLIQTGKSEMFPIVLVDAPGGDYWKTWVDGITHCLLERRLISPEDLAIFRVTDRVEEAVAEIVGFYRVYHSMRYVGDELVFRLNRPLSPDRLARIQRDFSSILTGGTFRQRGALPAEQDDSPLHDLPRLVFRFNRRNHGRLRQLIDEINQDDQ